MLSTEKLFQRAIRKTNMQLFNDAIKDYNKLIEQDTGNAMAYFARGVDLCREMDMLSRLNEDEQYSMINKTYRIINSPNTEKYERALSDFNKTIQLETGFAFAYYNRAFIKYKLQDFNGAVKDYSSAIQLEPDLADAYFNRGLLLFGLNDKLSACQDFSKAGELGLTESYSVIKLFCSQGLH
jgi:tetratricopeptide (TPR) repeat protein